MVSPTQPRSRCNGNKIRHKKSKQLKFQQKINRAKIKARSELDVFAWDQWRFRKQDYWISPNVDTIPRIDYQKTAKEEFIRLYESENKPVVIINAINDWPANISWNEKYFLDYYGSHRFKIGEDDNGDNVYMKMKHFLYYANHDGLQDDSPLYIFDSGFHRNRLKKKGTKKDKEKREKNPRKQRKENEPLREPKALLDDYSVPSYFSDDLFRLTGDQRRPPYKWIVIGGARSGTGIHTDPLGTSAWNALIRGHKRWAMFPPGTDKSIIDPPMKPYDHEGVTWFSRVFPKFQVRDPDGVTLGERLGMVQLLQRPGEVVFVPGGWAHVVMNLDMTFAVTQNFCSPTNLEYVYLSTRHSRPKLGLKLYREIGKLAAKDSQTYGDLANQLDTLRYVPRLPPSDSDSSDGSSSSTSLTSSSESCHASKVAVSSTESETDLSDGTCMCVKCKLKRKRDQIMRT